MATIVEKLEEILDEIDGRAIAAGRGEAGRQFALAKTAAEETMMRYTRGRALEEGEQRNFDFDAA